MIRRIPFPAVLCAVLLHAEAQHADQQILRLHEGRKFAEAVELCIQEAEKSTVAKFFLGEYYYHGIPGILEAIPERGREYYRKARDGLGFCYSPGATPADCYRFARCTEFGYNSAENARSWYVKAASVGETNAIQRVLRYLEERQISLSEMIRADIPKERMTLRQKTALAFLYLASRSPEIFREGKALLFETARAGYPPALAGLGLQYYSPTPRIPVSDRFENDYEKAVRFMKAAIAKGYPADHLPLEDALRCIEEVRKQKIKDAIPAPPNPPGDGYPGKLLPYSGSADFKPWLERFHLTAGWFQRNDIHPKYIKDSGHGTLSTNAIPYLLYTPKNVRHPVPIVIYFGGTGEHGTNLVHQFHQKTIFEKICSPEFQKRHPCYLFAPMVPKKSALHGFKGSGTRMSDLVCDALYAIIRKAGNPPVDTNRMYLTGLSYGGSAAVPLPFGYPGRFAAALPVAGYASKASVPDDAVFNVWLIFNEDKYNTTESRIRTVREIKEKIGQQGGDFRVSSFPGADHNAWDKAWREDIVWDWLFSKTADGNPLPRATGAGSPRPRLPAGTGLPLRLDDAICTASRPGRDNGTDPGRAADGLDATCYVSAEPMTRADWWQIEFARPVSGRITVQSGYRDGSARLSAGRAEVSEDGQTWKPGGQFLRTHGECRFRTAAPIRFLRVVPGSATGETLVLREVIVNP